MSKITSSTSINSTKNVVDSGKTLPIRQLLWMDQILPCKERIADLARELGCEIPDEHIHVITELSKLAFSADMPAGLRKHVDEVTADVEQAQYDGMLGFFSWEFIDEVEEGTIRALQARKGELMPKCRADAKDRMGRVLEYMPSKSKRTPKQNAEVRKWEGLLAWEAEFQCMKQLAEERDKIEHAVMMRHAEQRLRERSWDIEEEIYPAVDGVENDDALIIIDERA